MNPFSTMSFNKLKGHNFDFGFNYQFYRSKDSTSKDANAYLVNIGGVLSNMGKLNFNRQNTNQGAYSLNVSSDMINPSGLDLSSLGNISNVDDIQYYLSSKNYITGGISKNEIELKLPLLLNLYADLRLLKFLYTSIYWQKSIRNTIQLNQISAPDYLTVTPRIVIKSFELFIPFSSNSLSNPAIGTGVKIGKVYFASSSLISFATKSTKQIDFSFGVSYDF
jgi:hypothetical protein